MRDADTRPAPHPSLGIYVLTATRDANPGLREGWRSVLGRGNLKPEYHLCDVEEKDPV